MRPGESHTEPKIDQNRKNRNQKMAKKSMEKIAAGPIVAAIYSEVGIYVFFIDFEGHASDPGVAQLLTEVQNGSQAVKLLGSYPKAVSVAS